MTGPDLHALPGADLVDLDAFEAAARAGLPPAWRLYHRVDHTAETTYLRWTATRGTKPCVWSHLPLRLGLRSTLVASSIDALRTEAWRQEYLGVVYTVALTLARVAVRSP